MPKDVRAIAEIGLRKDYVFLDTVGADENTHQHVPQHYLITTKESQVFFFLFSFFLWVQMRTRRYYVHYFYCAYVFYYAYYFYYVYSFYFAYYFYTISSPPRSRR
jgi:hypothetical protein